METKKMQHQLIQNYDAFVAFVRDLSPETFAEHPPGKWAINQHLDHLIRSTSPLVMALSLPRWMLRTMVGKTERGSCSYTILVQNYQSKIKAGLQATGRYIPHVISKKEKERAMRGLSKNILLINQQIDKLTEADLDTYLLPHPGLGKLTIREMMYFTIYHAEHHLAQIKQQLSNTIN